MPTGKPVTIRPAQISDAAEIRDIYNEAIATTTATFDTQPKTLAERQAWIESHDDRHPILVAELDMHVVGWASLTRWSDRPAYDGTAETSFYVAAEARGRGIGRLLKQHLIEEARRCGYRTLLARVAEGNAASIHLNEQFGFQHVGTMKQVGRKFEQLLDVHLMQLMLEDVEPSADPSEIRTAEAPGQKASPEETASTADRYAVIEQLEPPQLEDLAELFRSAWWATQRQPEELPQLLAQSSLYVGIVESASGRLVGFARTLSDFTYRATIFDVIVAPSERSKGLGAKLIDALVGHPRLQRVSTIWLSCLTDMVPFYERWDFTTYNGPMVWMCKQQRAG